MVSRVLGVNAGTMLPPSASDEIAWDDHRIKFFSSYARGRTVLDIGCVQHNPENYKSKHWVHKALVAAACRVVGLDLYEDGVSYLRAQGFDIRLADASDFDLHETFDVIVAGDVIEHLDHAAGFLECCRRHLSKDGVLLITTDSPWFWRHIARAALLGTVKNNPEHVCWYDPVLLRQLAQRHGFTLDEGEVSYGAREWWLRIAPLPAPLKYPTFHAVLRPVPGPQI
jgi:SAM-dependent methyltransferase